MEGNRVQVWFRDTASSGDIEAVQEVLRSEGISAQTRTYPPLPVGDGMGFFVIVVIAGPSIAAFLNGYFGAAGKDAWEGTKRLVHRLRDSYHDRYDEVIRSSNAPPEVTELELELLHEDSGARVFLRSSHPDEAYRRLLDMEFKPDTWYVWEAGEWVEVPPGRFGFTPDREEWERIRGHFLSPAEPPAPPPRETLRHRLRRLFRR